jgi:hypothetical protein
MRFRAFRLWLHIIGLIYIIGLTFVICFAFGVHAQAVNPPGTTNFNVTLTENGKPDGTPAKDLFQRQPGDASCEKCPPLTLAAACVGVLHTWNDIDQAEYVVNGRLDENAKVGQILARDKLARRIEADPQAVTLSPAEQTKLVRLLSRVVFGFTFKQAVDIVSPNEPVPELK